MKSLLLLLLLIIIILCIKISNIGPDLLELIENCNFASEFSLRHCVVSLCIFVIDLICIGCDCRLPSITGRRSAGFSWTSSVWSWQSLLRVVLEICCAFLSACSSWEQSTVCGRYAEFLTEKPTLFVPNFNILKCIVVNYCQAAAAAQNQCQTVSTSCLSRLISTITWIL